MSLQNTFTKLTSPLMAAVLFSAAVPIAAQDFSVGVQQDPRAGTAIYEFHFQGPPNGAAYLFFGALGQPLHLPPLGTLYLDPRGIHQVPGATRLDGNGGRTLRITLPLTDNTFTPCFQVAFVDVRATVKLSKSAHCVVNAAVWNTPFGYLFDHDTTAKQTDMFVRGRPGTTVTYRLRRGGKIIASKIVPIGANGTGNVRIPGGVAPGDRWSVVYTDKKNKLGIGRSGTY